jgi:hypothetical protein
MIQEANGHINLGASTDLRYQPWRTRENVAEARPHWIIRSAYQEEYQGLQMQLDNAANTSPYFFLALPLSTPFPFPAFLLWRHVVVYVIPALTGALHGSDTGSSRTRACTWVRRLKKLTVCRRGAATDISELFLQPTKVINGSY